MYPLAHGDGCDVAADADATNGIIDISIIIASASGKIRFLFIITSKVYSLY
jgi:hypothetical protein